MDPEYINKLLKRRERGDRLTKEESKLLIQRERDFKIGMEEWINNIANDTTTGYMPLILSIPNDKPHKIVKCPNCNQQVIVDDDRFLFDIKGAIATPAGNHICRRNGDGK